MAAKPSPRPAVLTGVEKDPNPSLPEPGRSFTGLPRASEALAKLAAIPAESASICLKMPDILVNSAIGSF